MTSLPVEPPEPTGPALTRRNGRAFAGVESGGSVMVLVREGEAQARAWVGRRALVRVRGQRRVIVPTAVWVDDDDNAWLTVDADE